MHLILFPFGNLLDSIKSYVQFYPFSASFQLYFSRINDEIPIRNTAPVHNVHCTLSKQNTESKNDQ